MSNFLLKFPFFETKIFYPWPFIDCIRIIIIILKLCTCSSCFCFWSLKQTVCKAFRLISKKKRSSSTEYRITSLLGSARTTVGLIKALWVSSYLHLAGCWMHDFPARFRRGIFYLRCYLSACLYVFIGTSIISTYTKRDHYENRRWICEQPFSIVHVRLHDGFPQRRCTCDNKRLTANDGGLVYRRYRRHRRTCCHFPEMWTKHLCFIRAHG